MIRKKLFSLLTFLSSGLIFCGTLFLGISSLFIYAQISFSAAESTTYHFNHSSYFVLLVLSIGLLFFLLTFIEKINTRYLFLLCTLLFLIGGITLIVTSPEKIRSDAAIVFNSAISMNQGDFSSLNQTQYLGIYPFQLGLVSYDRLLVMFYHSPRVLYFTNLLLVIGINYLLWKLFSSFSLATKKAINLVVLASFLFIPQFFFILFGYGNIPGFFFFMLACFLTQQFLTKKNISYLILSFIAMALACLLKNNYLIGAIALACLYFLQFLKNKSFMHLMALLILLIIPTIASSAVSSYYSNVSGIDVSKGMPKILWVTMGLQNDPKSKLEVGWYTAYPKKIYKKVDFDESRATEIGKQDLKKELLRFKSSPSYAFEFFMRKIFSTWLEPSYQSVWSTPLLDEKKGFYYEYMLLFMHVFITLIFLLSAFYYALCAMKRICFDIISLLPGIYFIGGFMFHLFWETKSQYVYTYVFFLIIPATLGIATLYDKMKGLKNLSE